MNEKSIDVVLLAAGIGTRTGLNYPKQFYKINGKPFFIMSLEIFDKMKEVNSIIITCAVNYMNEYDTYLQHYNIKKAILIEGGKTRQESTYNALQKVTSSKVLIHEAARPLISHDFVEEILTHEDEVAVVPTIPVPFTVCEGDENMTNILDRQKLKNIQLPQLFDTKELLIAHKDAKENNYEATEDGILMFRMGKKVKFVKGRESNIKITSKTDIIIVNLLINSND
ncbi:MAG: 2-C-methyl-D-erythritol 4-phosphate cytidylyltransferase [Chitinophagaceae bacterium]|nr:2-C-methyl-D-erythritol 4-phosphate cytidylyltransferase [Chitinophagaceae bacterium]